MNGSGQGIINFSSFHFLGQRLKWTLKNLPEWSTSRPVFQTKASSYIWIVMYKVIILFWQSKHHFLQGHLVLPARMRINPAVNTALFKQVCDVTTESDEKEARTYQPPTAARTSGSCMYDSRVSTLHAHNCHFQCHTPSIENSKDRSNSWIHWAS
jgi:hypothetical protein